MKLGDMIKKYREEHRYSLRDFANLCGGGHSHKQTMRSVKFNSFQK